MPKFQTEISTFSPGGAVTVYPLKADVWIGSEVGLSCNAYHTCDADQVIYWYKNENSNVIIQNDTSQLFVMKATSVQQSGLYHCCVLNEEGNCTPSEKAIVTVKGRLS